MKWLLDISIRGKLILAFGVLTVLMFAAIISGFRAIIILIRDQRAMVNQDFADRYDMATLILEGNGVRADLLTMMATADEEERASAEQSIRAASRRIDLIEAGLRQRNSGNAPFMTRFEEYSIVRAAFVDTRDTQVIPLIEAGDLDQARQVTTGIQQDRFAEMSEVLGELSDEAEAAAGAAMDQSTEAARSTSQVFLVVGALTIGVSIGLVVLLTRGIARPIAEVSTAANEIAAGNFEIALSPNARKDEVGELNRAFAAMAASLSRVAKLADRLSQGDLRQEVEPRSERDALNKALRRMVENLRRLNSELQEGIHVLASSAGEIVASSAQVSAAAQETATAVNQTMATVEEVNQSTEVSARKAAGVSEAAKRVAEVSEEGRRATGQTTDGIRKIREQMESIAGSIVRLSEQTQSIGEIIATVNDLSEQSNLLAVNAAIEASKAGEHGRGFAVVAQEIRNLASQSKEATGQVRKIINDIQSAMSAAVMVTEQGTRAAETGVELSSRTADIIEKLAQTIGESSQMAAQIGASSQQQKAGMSQVALAMENIKQASAQNVAATGQTDAAAQRIEDLGRQLKALVEQYEL